MEIISPTSWIVDVIRRATQRPVRALSALVIGVVIHALWRKRANASNTELENAPFAETTVEAPSSNTRFEGLDPGNENQNEETAQLDPEAKKSQDSSAAVLSEKVLKTLEVSNGFETSSRKSLGTEVSINVDNALPDEKGEVEIPTSSLNGTKDTDNSKFEKEPSAEATDKEDGYLEQFPNNEILKGIMNNSVKTVDSSKNVVFASHCDSSNGEANNTYRRLIATLSMLNEYDTNVGLVKKSPKSLIELLAPDEKSNLPLECNGSSEEPESSSVGFRKVAAKDNVAAILEKFFNSTEELIKKTEASVQRFRVKVLGIVEDDDDFGSSEDGLLDARKSEVESLSSTTRYACLQGQGLGYINENRNGKSEQLTPDVMKSKDSSMKVLSEEEVFRVHEVSNGLKRNLGRNSETDVSTRTLLASEDVLPEKREVIVNGDNNNNALGLSENPRTEGCQKDQVLNNDGANILNCFQRESDERKVESSKLKLIEDLKLDDNEDHKENPNMSNFMNTDFFVDYVDACDMLLSLTQSLQLSHVVLNGFTLYDDFATCSYYTKLLISNLMPGNCIGKAILNNHSNLGSENNLNKNERVSDNDTRGKLKDICKTNTNFKNFILREFLKEGLIPSYHIPENDTRQGTLTAGYREPEYQYLLDGTCDSGEKKGLLESSFEESNETTEDGGFYRVSSYTLPEEVKGNISISSLDGELEVQIEPEDFEIKTYKVISADLLRYETGSLLDFGESKDPFRPSFPSPKVEKEQRGRDDSLKFEDSFTVNPVRDGSETNRCIESNKLEADVGESSENVFSEHQESLKNDSGQLLQNAGLEDSLGLKRKVESGSFYTEETDRETGENINFVLLLQVDPEKRPVNAKGPIAKGDGFELIEDRDDDDDDDDDDDEKKADELDDNSSEWRKGEDRGEEDMEKCGESSGSPGDGHNGGGTGSSGGGGDDKKNGDSKGKNKKDESSEDGQSDSADGEGNEDDDEKNEAIAEVSSERDKNNDLQKNGKGGIDTEKKISKDPKVTEIVLAMTSLNVDHSKKLRYDALYSYKIKHKVRNSSRMNTSRKFESPKQKKVEGEEKDKEGDDEQTKDDNPSGGKEEHGEKDRRVKEGAASSGEIGGAAYGSGGGSGSSGGGGGDYKKKGDDFVRGKIEDDEKSSEEDDKNESKDTPRPPTKDLTESKQNEGNSCGLAAIDSLQAMVDEVTSQASNVPGKIKSPIRKRTVRKIVIKKRACRERRNVSEIIREHMRNLGIQSNPNRCSTGTRLFGKTPSSAQHTKSEGGEGCVCDNPECECECRQATRSDQRSNEDLGNLPQPRPAPTRSSDPILRKKETLNRIEGLPTSWFPTFNNPVLKSPNQMIDEIVQRFNNPDVDQQSFSSCDSTISKKGKGKDTQEKGDGLRKLKYPTGPTEPKRPKNAEDATVSAAKGSKSPKASKPKKVAIKSSECTEESTEPKRPKNAKDSTVSAAKGSKSPKASIPKKVAIKRSECTEESTEPKRPKNAKDSTVSAAKGSKSPKASKPKKVAIKSSECDTEESTEPLRPRDPFDALVIAAIRNQKSNEPKKASEKYTVTIEREKPRKPKKPKAAEARAAAPKPKEETPEYVRFGQNLVPSSEINQGASCSHTYQTEDNLEGPLPTPPSPFYSREPAGPASGGQYGETPPYYVGYPTSFDFSSTDEDIGSLSDDNMDSASFAPPPPDPQDPHSGPENVDEMQEQNLGPLDLSFKK